MKGPDRQIWYAVTFDGRAPGQDGRLNYAGYNPDRAYAVEEAVEKALQQGTDMSRMRVWHHSRNRLDRRHRRHRRHPRRPSRPRRTPPPPHPRNRPRITHHHHTNGKQPG